MVQLAKNAPCCYKLTNSWCCALVLSIPFGGLSGLSFSMYGIAWFYDGLERFTNALEDLGVRNASRIIALFDSAVIIMMIANVLVVMYGFREKCRYRKGLFHHFSWRDLGFNPPCCLSCILFICSPCFLKFLLKSSIHLVVITSVGLWLLSAFIVELIWIIFQAIDAICSGTSGGDVQDVLDLIHGDANESVDEICDAMQDAKAGSGIVFVGCLIIVISQIIVVAYWYKYSTLALADQLYTTDDKGGRWRKSRSGSKQIVVGDMQEGATSSSGENEVTGAGTNSTLIDDQPKEFEIATKGHVV